MTKTILIVDDDPHIREVLIFALEKAGMLVLSTGDGRQAIEVFNRSAPDLIVLDISMPEIDGFEVCRQIRKSSDIPIVFLSSRDEEIDKIVGLEIGGDDYVTKPFSPRELVARVNVILKRQQRNISTAPSIQFSKGHVILDPERYTASYQERTIHLTATEFMLLAALFRSPEKIFTRNQLMDHAYDDAVAVSDRTIDSHIRRIRSKFAAYDCYTVIETSHGIGYKLGSCQ